MRIGNEIIEIDCDPPYAIRFKNRYGEWRILRHPNGNVMKFDTISKIRRAWTNRNIGIRFDSAEVVPFVPGLSADGKTYTPFSAQAGPNPHALRRRDSGND